MVTTTPASLHIACCSTHLHCCKVMSPICLNVSRFGLAGPCQTFDVFFFFLPGKIRTSAGSAFQECPTWDNWFHHSLECGKSKVQSSWVLSRWCQAGASHVLLTKAMSSCCSYHQGRREGAVHTVGSIGTHSLTSLTKHCTVLHIANTM